jgi:NAD(P)-dependent dehydrogenase (short-subunit alcohol dehydrogenase family)
VSYKWTEKDIPDLTGKIIVVTGANKGLGYETVRMLNAKNASVIMACRSIEKGKRALGKIESLNRNTHITLMRLDLSDMESIRSFAEEFLRRHDRLDILINNAGVILTRYSHTKDGLEIQFGTNHIGHFLLTGLLIDRLTSTEQSRVVTVSSLAHKWGRLNLDDLNWERRKYRTIRAYGDSKISNLYFGYELNRKLSKKGYSTMSVASHPGWAATSPLSDDFFSRWGSKIVAQRVDKSALTTLYAGVSNEVSGGDFIGPSGLLQIRGYPKKVRSNDISYDESIARCLWEKSEQICGMKWDL